MSRNHLYSLLSHVHRTRHADANGLPDAELLERFVRLRDEAAFELLVWRHERLVLGVCRRLLRDEHDAEDAFQAAFLTLARKAASIGRREAVVSWLYKVAYRCAARMRETVRRQRQGVVNSVDPANVTVPDPGLAAADHADLRDILDEEVQRLPAKYRTAIVLCYLEGKSYQQAANELRCPVGTLSARLHTARERLRVRLTARGIAPAAALAVLESSRETHAAARLALVAVQAAQRIIAGQNAANVVSSRTLEIATGVVQAMSASKQKIIVLVVLMGCLSGLTSWTMLRALPQAPRERPAENTDKPEGRPSARPGAEAALTPERILEEALRATRQVKDGNEGRLLEKIAAVQGKAGHRAVADRLFQQAGQSLEKTAAWRDARQKAFLLAMRASLLGESGDREAAHKTFQQALRIARSLDKGNGRIDMMQFLARQQGEGGDLAEARETAKNVQPGFYRDQVLADIALCQAKQGDRDRRMSRACAVAIFSSFPKAAETLLRAVLEKNPDRRVQGCACLNLAQMLQERSRSIQALRRAASPKLARHYEAVYGKDYLNALQSSNPREVLHETEKLYERVLEKYADVKVNDLLLSEYAKRAVFEIRNLSIGKPAPEIEGEDLDGKRFKLSDYRGQVVMLVFCGNWCSACRSLYPRERALVKKMEGRPFVLLEVNSDEDRDKAKKTRQEEKLGWRVWWDGGTAGPISQHWNLSGWPTIYVLDANGVIRFKDFVADMEGTVDGLLKERAAKRAK